MNNERVDGFAVLALAFLFFLGFQIISDRAITQPAMAMDEVSLEDSEAASLQSIDFIDYAVIGQPYEDYYLTQGLHGFSYGELREIFLIVLPFTKLTHMFTAFIARWYNGAIFGRKGVQS